MNKAFLILQREYLTRVKKKSFIVITLLVPIAFAAIIGFSIWISLKGAQENQHIAVYDETGQFLNRLKENELLHFTYIPQSEYEQLRSNNNTADFNAILHIPHNLYTTNHIRFFSTNQVPGTTQSKVKNQLEKLITNDKQRLIFEESGQPELQQKLASTRTRLQVDTIKFNDDGSADKVSTEINTIVGFIGGFLIYTLIFMYGAMVMRGVAEEKTNRISEVLVSSVKPMQLLFGKIVGIGLVGLTQFIMWIAFGAIILQATALLFNTESIAIASQSQNIMSTSGVSQIPLSMSEPNGVQELINSINSLNISLILTLFFLFFTFGYLLYASIMGAIGSAVSSDEDAQQLVSIIAMPLIMAIIMVTPIAENPNGTLAFWTSIFPLFSPVCMMTRIPAGIPSWEIALSLSLLAITTLLCMWVASKIYRTGILLYGKKASLKELLKWLRY